MKFNKILLSAALLSGALCGYAQEEVTEYTFTPHWYVQGQFGVQETLGEASFGDLISPNAQIAAGYNFNPYIGARLAVNAWQSKAANKIDGALYSHDYKWKWNYVAPTVDLVLNLTNVFGGYRPTRLVDVDLIAGMGVNIGFKNDQANSAQADYFNHTGQEMLGNLWSGTKCRFMGQFGADINFNVSEHVAVGLELTANVLNDKYNSKKAGNADWYFNGLVGVKYTFGSKYSKSTRVIPAPEPRVIERIVERVVEQPVVQAPVQVVTNTIEKAEPFRRDIFFTISNYTISKPEMAKVAEVAEFLKNHPGQQVVITGYADKGTGTMAINLRLSKQRAQTVANTLTNKYGIAKNRIVVKSMGEAEDQPYDTPEQNRVAICIIDAD